MHTAGYMEVCLITACTLAAVLCTRQSVQSAEIDEVSNIVVVIFILDDMGGLVKLDGVCGGSFSLANSQSYDLWPVWVQDD